MLKKPLLFILILSLPFISCSRKAQDENTIQLSVSILPQKYIIDRIGGDLFQVNVLIPPGASPASYDPTPSQLTSLSKSGLYFRIGEIVFEKSWMESLEKQNPDMKVCNMAEGIVFIENDEHNHDADDHDHDHGHYDPHIWMSPANFRKMAANTLTALLENFPDDSSGFKENYNALITEVDSIDVLYRSASDKLNGLHFLIYHPALTYLAKDYGMIQHVLEKEGKEPGAAHMARIIDTIDEHGISTIFVQKQFNQDNARTLARERGIRVVQIDPLDENWPVQMQTILNYLINKAPGNE